MCSLEEAWGDMDNITQRNPTTLPTQRQQQQQSMYPQPDQPGQYYTQADDRRQYAKPVAELSEYRDWHSDFNRKALPSANGLVRGVHDKYSREKRIPGKDYPDGQGAGMFSGLQTDVDPKYYIRPDNYKATSVGTPAYLDTYPAPKYEIPNVGVMSMASAVATGGDRGPMAANSVVETFESFGTAGHAAMDMFKDFAASPNNKFTPEMINDTNMIQNAEKAETQEMSFAKPPVINKEQANVQDHIIAGQQIKALTNKITELERKLASVETNKSHDIILFIVIGIFILFVLDNIFKLGRFL